MKLLLCFAALVVFAASERCTNDADCTKDTTTTCNGAEEHCSFHFGGTHGSCICTQAHVDGKTCQSESDCTSIDCTSTQDYHGVGSNFLHHQHCNRRTHKCGCFHLPNILG